MACLIANANALNADSALKISSRLASIIEMEISRRTGDGRFHPAGRQHAMSRLRPWQMNRKCGGASQ